MLGGQTMRKLLFSVLILLVCAGGIWAVGPILSVSDFTVESDNPQYKYLGKGLAILVTSELRKSAQVQIIEREQLNQVLKEQEVSLSDLADPQTQIKVGKILASQYIVLGKVVDMAWTLLVSVRIVDVSSGVVVWEDNVNEKLSSYDYIGAYFAKSILTHFGAAAVATTVQKVEKKEEKQTEAVIALSQGVDALDKNDTQAAQKALEKARKLDPASEAAAFYLSKLTVNTTKFQITVEPYYTYQNPAYLGINKTDKLYWGASLPAYGFVGPARSPIAYINSVVLPNGSNYISEFNMASKLGYSFPVGRRLGISLDAMILAIDERIFTYVGSHGGYEYSASGIGAWGGILSLGYRILDSVSLGMGVTVYGQQLDNSFPFSPPESVSFTGNAGAMFFNPDETFILDTRVGYGTATMHPLDPDTLLVRTDQSIGIPLYNENTVTFALNGKHTFVIVKEMNDIALDRPYYFGRLLPAVEQFFSDWFSLRLGMEGSFMILNGTPGIGYGAVLGTTIRVIPWGMDFDLNFSYRFRPSYVIAVLLYPDFGILFTISKNDLGISRK
jgi:TolB-like protein